MNKHYEFSDNNILRQAEKTVKKDDGIKAVLSLLQDLYDFKDKVSACMESQSNVETRQSLERFYGELEDANRELLAIAGGGVQEIRQRPEGEAQHSGDTLPSETPIQSPIEPSIDI